MNSNVADPKLEALLEDDGLVHRAQSGDAAAFVQLYDAYVEPIYRYVYFQVINAAAAESISSQVFRLAWQNLNSWHKNGSSFFAWIQEIAKNQVTDYYKTDLKYHTLDTDFLSVAAEYGLNKEVQDLIRLETMGNHLRFLMGDTKQSMILRILNLGPGNRRISRLIAKLEGDVRVLQVITLRTVASFLDHLNLGREIKPSPQFTKRTRRWLAQYAQFHTRRPAGPSIFWRMALTYTALVAALLVTGTAKAQSALPGDMLYGWKRTSEQAWLSVSPDPVGASIILANRRLNEWIAVENDPERSGKASSDYFNALTKLKPAGDSRTSARIITVLRAHGQRLNDAGLSAAPLNQYLEVAANPAPNFTSSQTSPAESAQQNTQAANVSAPPASESSTEVAPPASGVSSVFTPPTGVPPAPTAVPTVISPATEVPTQAASASTEVPTVISAPTEAATEVSSPATAAPTQVAAPATEAPSEAAPSAATGVAATNPPPPAPTDVAATNPPPLAPTDAAPANPPPPAPAVGNPVVPTQDPNSAPTQALP